MSSQRTPEEEPPAPTTATVAEPTVTDAGADKPSFAERVGQRKRFSAPDPYLIATDALAGVRLFESKQDRQMAIKFGEGRPEDKPSQAVIDTLKEAGYRWNPLDKIWTRPIRSESAMSTRIEAERLYQDIRHTIRQEKGIETSQEVPF